MDRVLVVLAILLTFAWGPGDTAQSKEVSAMTLKLTSTALAHRGQIPSKYTCDGEDISPPLAWSSVPAEAKSLVLIVDDPDAPDPAAPKMTWVHWVLYNIPPSASALPEGARQLPAGTLEGVNDWKRTGYGGPCPPIGRHRYFHKLYAIDILGFRQHPANLVFDAAGGAVGIQRRVGLHLRSVQRHQPQPDQPHLAAQLQHLQEHALHPSGMPLPKPRNHGVVRRLVADDKPVTGVAPAQPLDHPARSHPVAVGVDQQRQNHRRPKIKALAQREKAEIFFGDARSHALRSSCRAHVG